MTKMCARSTFSYFLTIMLAFLLCSIKLQATPQITSINPLSGPATAGQSVTITGTGFTTSSSPVNQVFFGLAPAQSFVVNSDTQITAVSPTQTYLGLPVVQGTPGVVDVTVTTATETSPLNENDRYAFKGDWTVFLPDFSSAQVYVSDTSTNYLNAATIAVENGPNDVAISYDGRTAYCVNSISNTVSVIDVGSQQVINTINVGQAFPILMAVAFDPVTTHTIGYTANLSGNSITQIDLTSGMVLQSVPTGGNGPTGGIITSLNAGTNAVAYVPNSSSSFISRIDFSVTPPSVSLINTNVGSETGSAPSFIALAPDGSTAYFADTNPNQNAVKQLINVNTATPSVGPIVITDPSINFNFPSLFPQIAIAPPQGNPAQIYAYVTNTGDIDNALSVTTLNISDNNNPFVSCILPGGFGPNGAAITPDGSRLYVCNASNSNEVTVTSGLPGIPPTCSVTAFSQKIGDTPTDPTVTPDQPPLAHFTAIPSTVVSGNSITFNAASSISPVGTTLSQPNGIASYTWNFGDGSPSITTTNPVITHPYTDLIPSPTPYTVTLTVTNLAGTSTLASTYFNGQFALRNGQPIGSGQTAIYTSQIIVQTTGNTSSTAITSSANPSNYGDSVTFTATVMGSAGTPTGTVDFFEDGVTFLGTGTLVGGTTSITTGTLDLTAGNHVISANYGGDSTYNASAGVLTQQVNPAPTATTLSSPTPDPTTYGQPITFNAHVFTLVGTLSGSVNIIDITDPSNPVIIATPALDPATGNASTSYAFLDQGPHTLEAMYVPSPVFDPNHSSSVSAPLMRTVDPANTTTTLVTSGTPSNYGDDVTFTATVTINSPGGGTLNGEIDFFDNGNLIEITPISGGQNQASVTVGPPSTAPLSGGSHTITANFVSYSSDFNNSNASLIQAVNPIPPNITVFTTPNPSTYGSLVTITATVSSPITGGSTPTGTVTFTSSDGTPLGTRPLVNGVATITTSGLLVGPPLPTITAVYNPNGNTNYTSVTGTRVQRVNPVTPGIAVAATPASTTYGQPVTITATLSPVGSGAIPTGTVTFTSSDNTSLGTSPLVNGVATFITSGLLVGTPTLTAAYNPDTSNYTVVQGTTTHTVTAVTPTITVSTTPNPSTYGSLVTITATVSPITGGLIPTGTVTFTSSDNTSLGTSPLVSGVATITTSLLNVGMPTITAVYHPDITSNYTTVTGTTTQTVTAVTPGITVSTTPNPSVYGQLVTITATLFPVGGGIIPTGTVTFTSSDGTPLGSATLSGGVATVATSSFLVNTATITAHYNGDNNYAITTGITTQTINKDPTTTIITSSSNPSIINNPVVFTATVTANLPGSGTPTGTVTFVVNGGAPIVVTLNSNRQAVLSPQTFTTPGSYIITATYSGDTNFFISTNSFTQFVQGITTTAVTASPPSPSSYGEPVTFTATITPTLVGPLTGTVQFIIDGQSYGAPVPVNGNLMASLTTSTLAVGPHLIAALYSGDESHASSLAPNIPYAVNPDSSLTTLVSSVNPSTFGQQVVFTATVTAQAPGAGIPTGTASFSIDGGPGITVSLVNGQASLPISNLTAGNHIVTVTYSGDPNFTSSSSSLVQTVNAVATTITVTSSINPANIGQPVTFFATVSQIPGFAPPTGTVIFSIDGVLGTPVNLVNGQASVQTSSLSAGNHTIIAIYSGDANYLPSTSSPFIETIISIFPPRDLGVFQEKNKFASQTDRINVLLWKAPKNGSEPVSYKIYRNKNLTNLIATVKGHQSSSSSYDEVLTYKDHDRKPGRSYDYYIVSVDAFGNISSPAKIVFYGEQDR